ncbi:hypothetical protein COURTHOUSE_121 [Mycobacterium phage Courthouse]|uniref:Uncharacterized protein n=2 Tax=Omegavirus courthouse TaxID=1089119 RepID=G8I5H8_9CAUD|nr:hypothetical protein CM09_gp121 [Mycobacterium phage Courthouse]YP_009205256.1 hypothetical protein AVT17_gp126 [Mycobacterium phage Ariel]AER47972.1 hypothetical protein COURTHOUSE_121 [Mycobacterium phage Courthouse]AIM50003.1 hypothetical protein PBI_ARIEL_126 [Mycobacterium phage Ariel]ATS92964.1 hypothetical protein SEA_SUPERPHIKIMAN_123 [Mycobacterium phage Superphikiman]
MEIDTYLDRYAAERIAGGLPFKWWWNADTILADTIASACEHLLDEGTTAYSSREEEELRTLNRYMVDYDFSSGDEGRWLHAEAMWLLGKWFTRLWD